MANVLLILGITAVVLGLIGLILHYSSIKRDREMPRNLTIILFYAPWCKFCKEFEPVWNELKKANSDVKFVEVNGDEDTSSLEQFGVKKFPTVVKVHTDGTREVLDAHSAEDREFAKVHRWINY